MNIEAAQFIYWLLSAALTIASILTIPAYLDEGRKVRGWMIAIWVVTTIWLGPKLLEAYLRVLAS
jgi:hypothetical protein